jgi:hypothetical protein
MDPGENQDFGEWLAVESISDLQLVIHAGKNLNRAHCAELEALPHLECLLAGSSGVATQAPRPDDEPPIPDPSSVRTVIRRAIQELRMLSSQDPPPPHLDDLILQVLEDPDDAAHYCETRMRLFGFTRSTQGLGPVKRREAARAYYNEHLNHKFRKAPVKTDNFRKNVVPELCVPVVAMVWVREMELREQREDTLAGIALSTETISHQWTEVYWWLFRLSQLLIDAAIAADRFIRTRDHIPIPQMELPDWMPTPEPVEQSDAAKQASAERSLKLSLYKVAVIWRFIDYDGWPQGWIEYPSWSIFSLPKLTVSDVLSSFQESFVFTEPDSDWIDRTLNGIFRDTIRNVPQASFALRDSIGRGGHNPSIDAFVDAVDADPFGQVVYRRFAALTGACRCYIDPDSDACIFHVLVLQATDLSNEVDAGWLALAKTEVGMRDSHSVPERNDID